LEIDFRQTVFVIEAYVVLGIFQPVNAFFRVLLDVLFLMGIVLDQVGPACVVIAPLARENFAVVFV
jgi:hypothetical protein